MKTRSMLIGVAMAAALNCAAVNAQVLGGGSIGGGLGGTLSGGMRDMNVMTQGAMNGSLGADLDTGSLRRTTRGTAERATDRVRDTSGAVKDRAASKIDQTRDTAGAVKDRATTTLDQARDTTAVVSSAAAASATGAVNDVQIEGAADVAGSAASSVSRDGVNLAGDGQGAASGGALSKPELLQQQPGKLADQETSAAPSETETQDNSGPAKVVEPKRALNLSGDAKGSASASRDGVSGDGGGSMSASRK